METAKGVCSTAAELRKKLIEEHSCDLVIPMTHQVMADDRAFAREKMGFPLICGAHDHEAYMEQVEGAWIVKAGMDASNALIIDIKWPAPETKGEEPTISVELVPTKDYPANPQLVEVVKKHMQAVEDMETAFLWPVPKGLQLSSKEVRRKQTSIGAAVTSLIRDGLRGAAGHTHACDGVMMDAGAVRRNFDYPADYPAFTYGDLKKEITFDSDILVVSLRGAVVNAAVQASRERAYREPPEDWGGFLQLDDGFVWDEAKRAVTHINKQPLQPEKEYKVGVLALSLNGMNRNQPLIEWANAHADVEVAHAERARAAKEVVVDCCAKQVWWQLGAFEDLDTNHDGVITVEEIQDAMERKLHLHVNLTDAQNLLNIIDTDHSGSVDKDELMRATNAFLRRASS